MRYLARHLTIARLPPPGPPGGGMIPAQPSPAPSPPWPGSDGAAPGIPGAVGMAWRDWRWRAASASCGQPLVPTGPQSPARIFSNHTRSSWSPVTESNRRPSPYHACRFRLTTSGWVGLSQVRRMLVSERVALRLPLPGAVVTGFVTGPGVSVLASGSCVQYGLHCGVKPVLADQGVLAASFARMASCASRRSLKEGSGGRGRRDRCVLVNPSTLAKGGQWRR